jgi:uncharacterized protein YjbJ (UPF0337 family)
MEDQDEQRHLERPVDSAERNSTRVVGKLTNNDIDQIQGQSEQLVGKIQERYGIARDEAERQVNSWNPR